MTQKTEIEQKQETNRPKYNTVLKSAQHRVET